MKKNSFNKIFDVLQWFILIVLFLSVGYYKWQTEFLSYKYQEYVRGNTYVINYQSDQILKLKSDNVKLYKQINDKQINKIILNMNDQYLNKINKKTQLFLQEMPDVVYAQNIYKTECKIQL